MGSLKAVSCALLTLVGLVGCASDLLRTGGLLRTPPLRCPPAQVVEQASSYTRFAQADNIDTAEYTLRFARLSGECRLDEDGNLKMDIYMRFVAIPGGGMAAQQIAEASWFVVLLQDQGKNRLPKVLSRQLFTQQIPLQRGGDRQFIQEQYTITVADIGEEAMQDLVVLGGYVTDDAQWEFHEENPFFFR